jgi:hypothetical protein
MINLYPAFMQKKPHASKEHNSGSKRGVEEGDGERMTK